MSLSRKEIQRERMLRYFLDAATDVIKEDGIDHFAIRKIADKAGFTSSTVYNYFKDLSHLKFYAAMRFTTDYVNELPEYLEKGNNTVESWLYSWECFCKHSFEHPKIYSTIFMDNLGSVPEDLMKYYYQIHQKDILDLSEEIQDIIMEQSFSKRSALYIQNAVDEGFIEQENVDYIADITLLIWKGMMNTVINHRRKSTKEEAIQKTLHYVYRSVISIVVPEKRQDIHVSF